MPSEVLKLLCGCPNAADMHVVWGYPQDGFTTMFQRMQMEVGGQGMLKSKAPATSAEAIQTYPNDRLKIIQESVVNSALEHRSPGQACFSMT